MSATSMREKADVPYHVLGTAQHRSDRPCMLGIHYRADEVMLQILVVI